MSTPGELLEALGREARARFAGGGESGTRVYRGRSVEELVPQIQRELGADAIIVRRREGLTGGVLGFFQHQYVEIEAMPGTPGVDVYDEAHEQMPPAYAPAPPIVTPPSPPPIPPAPAPTAPPLRAPAYAPLEASPAAAAPVQPLAAPPAEPFAAPPPQRLATPPPQSFAAPAAQPSPGPAPAESSGSAYVTAHLAALARAGRAAGAPPRERTSALPPLLVPTQPPASSLQPPRSAPLPLGEPLPPSAPARRATAGEQRPRLAADQFAQAIAQPSAPPRVQAPQPGGLAPQAGPAGERREVAPGSQGRARAGVLRSLKRCGMGDELAEELIDGATAHALALAPRAGLAQAVRATLAQRIPVAPPLPAKGAAIVLVGAGGTGKTTCCAALLGAYRASSTLRASCATITRAGGSSSKGERGELAVVLSPNILRPTPVRNQRALRALQRAQSEGMVAIDTPSLSPANRAGVRELARVLSELEPERVVVTLPATLGATAAAQLLQALRPLGANALAVTHADETDQLGVAVEAACRFGLAPEYVLERASGGGFRLRHLDPVALAEKLLP